MELLEWAKERNEAMTIWDTGLLKIMAMLFGMVLGAELSSHVKKRRCMYMFATIVLAGVVAFRWFTAQKCD
ncbi:MAG: hypothetical protein GF344_02240 [Chitinivibrionales bacterium]|nr:hypothetical protein [Chitinivibrionales bacterium]MBD3355914.1 hypothetical protein [Chitinivibrionales bacterium]